MQFPEPFPLTNQRVGSIFSIQNVSIVGQQSFEHLIQRRQVGMSFAQVLIVSRETLNVPQTKSQAEKDAEAKARQEEEARKQAQERAAQQAQEQALRQEEASRSAERTALTLP